MTVGRCVLLTAMVTLLPILASAQDSTTRFRVNPDPNNMQACTGYNFGMTGMHTLAIQGSDVGLFTAGGLNTKMTMVRPNVYEAKFDLGGTRLDAVADLAQRTFTVAEETRGCKWFGVAE